MVAQMREPFIVNSNLGNYEVIFGPGSSHSLGHKISDYGRFFRPVKRNITFYDSNLNSDYFTYSDTPIEASEELKTLGGVQEIIKKFQELGVKRSDTINVFGGGTMQDAFGFACSIYMRGIKWNFFPTTLLSMADSCIGGKTCINFGTSKNILGNYNPPEMVYIEPQWLNTLPEEELLSGLGEISHIFMVRKKYQALKSLKEWYYDRTSSNIYEHIRNSLETKREVIQQDEFDKGERLQLNYGHTLGHAFEASYNYKVPHGVCVMLGAKYANKFSEQTNRMSAEFNKYLLPYVDWVPREFLNLCDLEFDMGDVDTDVFMSHLSKDKKNKIRGKQLYIGIILLNEGQPFLEYIKEEEIQAFIEKEFE